MLETSVFERPPFVSVETLVAKIAEQNGTRREFQLEDRLVDGGLTSLALVELMLAIESNYSIAIPDGELRARNFESIASIKAMLRRMMALLD